MTGCCANCPRGCCRWWSARPRWGFPARWCARIRRIRARWRAWPPVLRGLRTLIPTISLVTVLAVDAPDSPLLIPQLADALRQAGPQADAVAVLADGYVQPLGVLWRLAALQAALERVGDFTKAPLKRLLRGVNIVTITPTGRVERDYDTPEELQNLPPAVPIVPTGETQ